jgi:DNA invertase Pin-like site-specific DNA recombinase
VANRTRQGTRDVRLGLIGYIRVSTEEQATSGLGLQAQRAAIEAEASRRGEPLIAMYEDGGHSGKTLTRPGLTTALDALDGGSGRGLVVAKLDRLTRSVHDATGLMLRAERSGWGLVALDVAVDTTTPQGAAMAQVLAVFAELERRLIGQRTREALAVRRAHGARLGRPRTLSDVVVERIVSERAAGAGWSLIARGLDADEIGTSQGGARWWPATVRAVYFASPQARRAALKE